MHMIDTVRQDVRYAWRSILRTPGFTVMVVATLALGVGVSSAMYSFLDRVFLRPPSGVSDPSSLRRLWVSVDRRGERMDYQFISVPAYLAFKEDAAAHGAALAHFILDETLRLGRDRAAPPVHGAYATANYFEVLGVRPAKGRLFAADEDVMGRPVNVAVLSDAFWRTRLDADPEILGKTIPIGLTPYTVVGIMPKGFVGVDVQAADVWMPLGSFPGNMQGRNRDIPWYLSGTTYGARTVMRVPTRFDDAAFGARATMTMQRIARELQREPGSISTGSIIAARGPGELSPENKIALRVAGVALIVLLIATANVVNLLLARAARRRREIAVRLALGVSRARLIQMLVTESVALSLLGGGAAILAAWWGGDMLRTLLLPDIEWIDSGLDLRVIGFTLAVALLAGLLAGLVPALQSSSPRLATTLKGGGAHDGSVSAARLRAGLVALQAAFSVVLLVGASLFVRSLRAVESIDIGYDIHQTVMAHPQFEDGESPASGAVDAAMRDVAARLESRPGVLKVGRAGIAPMWGYGMNMYYADQAARASFFSSDFGPLFSTVSPGFFEASGLRLLRGRIIGGSEYAAQGTAPNEVVVNEIAAHVLYPGQDALGKCVRFGARENPCHLIVGIVENANSRAVIEGKMGHFYVALGSAAAADRGGGGHLIVKARPDAVPAVAAELRREIRRAFPLSHPWVRTMEETLERDYRQWRIGAKLFTAFGVLALLVALVGIYSSVSYVVGQRTREFGVRIALGANTREVLNQVLGDGLRIVATGVAAGIVIALAAGRLVRAMVFGVETTDVSAMLLAACSLLAVGAIAALVPAWRAARVDPVVTLKAE